METQKLKKIIRKELSTCDEEIFKIQHSKKSESSGEVYNLGWYEGRKNIIQELSKHLSIKVETEVTVTLLSKCHKFILEKYISKEFFDIIKGENLIVWQMCDKDYTTNNIMHTFKLLNDGRLYYTKGNFKTLIWKDAILYSEFIDGLVQLEDAINKLMK